MLYAGCLRGSMGSDPIEANITFASAIRFAKALQLTSFRSSETAMVQKMV